MNKSACNHGVRRVRVQGLLWDLLITHLPLWGSEHAFSPKANPDEPTLWKTAAVSRWIAVKCLLARKRSHLTKRCCRKRRRRWNKPRGLRCFKCKWTENLKIKPSLQKRFAVVVTLFSLSVCTANVCGELFPHERRGLASMVYSCGRAPDGSFLRRRRQRKSWRVEDKVDVCRWCVWCVEGTFFAPYYLFFTSACLHSLANPNTTPDRTHYHHRIITSLRC